LLQDAELYQKVLVFVPNKKSADLLYIALYEHFGAEVAVIHSNKTQNYRIRSIEHFNSGKTRMLVTTDVMSRGLDLDQISQVVNFDTPLYPENYMHRIGRTGRAEQPGMSLLFYTEKEVPAKEAIEALMKLEIPKKEIPKEIEISKQLTAEEQPRIIEPDNPTKKAADAPSGFHEKKEKNTKVNEGGSYQRIIKKKYKKPKTKGDKNYNKRNKKR
jgi:ATP-dependent RNA helicase RhlE